MNNPRARLDRAFEQAQDLQAVITQLTEQQLKWMAIIVKNAESQKAIIAVLATSLVKKIETPTQDVRYHKIDLPHGYSGRSFDTNHVTPFIQEKFPRLSMKSGSGWLTRSIEQDHPFTLDFPGKIRDVKVKEAFLQILNDIEVNLANPEIYLTAFLALLIVNAKSIETLVSPSARSGEVTIDMIIAMLKEHFSSEYTAAGASRLPVIAIYSIYQLLVGYGRYTDKTLAPLKTHTTSDIKSRTIGDVEVLNEDGSFFEAVEIKHNIPISAAIVQVAYDKFSQMELKRYYLLTTAEPNSVDPDGVKSLVTTIRAEHGCEVIVNGIVPSLKYYLRLLDDPAVFLDHYTENLQRDYEANTDIKGTHIKQWKETLASYLQSD